MPPPKHRRFSWTRTLLYLLAGFVLWSALLGGRIYAFAQVSDPEPADAAVVLGAAVYRDRPSPVFRERINHAVELYHSGQVGYLIFTGGFGPQDNLAESEAAQEYAISQGVPSDRILIETVSTDTEENLAEASRIMDAMGFDRVLIVSDPYHMLRAMAIAADLGLNASASPTTTSRYESARSQAVFLVREVYFYSAYVVVSWLAG
ncbi:MAG TPA: YdcF family protein [Anaerolineales bacterium]|nr:YdcF family protein [Anaerolineales bacterium]